MHLIKFTTHRDAGYGPRQPYVAVIPKPDRHLAVVRSIYKFYPPAGVGAFSSKLGDAILGLRQDDTLRLAYVRRRWRGL